MSHEMGQWETLKKHTQTHRQAALLVLAEISNTNPNVPNIYREPGLSQRA